MYFFSKEIAGNYALIISPDEFAGDVREDEENLGTMVTFVRNSNMGDEQPGSRGRWLADMLVKRGLHKDTDAYWTFDSDLRHDHDYATAKAWNLLDGHIYCLDLYVMNHSGYRMNISGFGAVDPGRWDWGWAGFIYVEREKALKEFDAQRMTKKIEQQVYERLKSEVEEYDDYLVYGVSRYDIYDISGYKAWCKAERIRHPDDQSLQRFLLEEAERIEGSGHFYGDPDESGLHTEAQIAFKEYKEKAQ
jgi:hypothetical protein